MQNLAKSLRSISVIEKKLMKSTPPPAACSAVPAATAEFETEIDKGVAFNWLCFALIKAYYK